jgi:hypothetical protein
MDSSLARIFYQNRPLGSLVPADKELSGSINIVPGGYSITTANGKFLSVQPNGSYQERDQVGAWETFVIDSSSPILRVHVWSGDLHFTYAIAFRAA